MTKEIDFTKIVRLIYNKRKVIITTAILSVAIGIIVALMMEKTFMANTTFIPEIGATSPQMGRVSRLASVAGLGISSISGDVDKVPPNLYPEIAQSVRFRYELLSKKIKIKGVEDSITYKEYYANYYRVPILERIKKYTLGLPKILISSLRKPHSETMTPTGIQTEDLWRLSQSDLSYLQLIKGQMGIKFDPEIGLIHLSFVMPEPEAAASMTLHAANLLQTEVIDYKLSKVKQELVLTQNILAKQSLKLQNVERRWVGFLDSNLILSTEKSKIEQRKLESEYNMEYEIYSDLVSKIKDLELKANRDTPVFTTINNVVVPIYKHEPNQPKIIILFVFVLVGLVVVYIIIREYLQSFQNTSK